MRHKTGRRQDAAERSIKDILRKAQNVIMFLPADGFGLSTLNCKKMVQATCEDHISLGRKLTAIRREVDIDWVFAPLLVKNLLNSQTSNIGVNEADSASA